MKFNISAPKPGTMVRVKIDSIYHYGIFVSEEEIIQFGLSPALRKTLDDKDIAVCASDLSTFLNGGRLETGVCENCNEKKRTGAEIIDYARSKIGQKGYNILYNNCEHFAYECVTGVKTCTQADEVRKLFRAVPIVDVYTAVIPEEIEFSSVYPKERDDEINSCGSKKVRIEKYCAWKLLEYALNNRYSLSIKDVAFIKGEDGKWSADKCSFSISHSNSMVAVAVSDSAVGVDLELVNGAKEKALEKVLTSAEKNLLDETKKEHRIEFLVTKWVQKESVFKANDDKVFYPKRIETSNFTVKTKKITTNGKDYILGVCSIPKGLVRYHDGVSL